MKRGHVKERRPSLPRKAAPQAGPTIGRIVIVWSGARYIPAIITHVVGGPEDQIFCTAFGPEEQVRHFANLPHTEHGWMWPPRSDQ